MTLNVKKRHRLRAKEVRACSEALRDTFGIELPESSDIDRAQAPDFDILIVNNELVAIFVDEVPFLSVRGLLKYLPEKRAVTVDMGAVPCVYNGADVMSPGIVAADPAIEKGDLVWIKDEKNGRPLAVGAALISGPEMVESTKGKAVRTIHHVGDDVWNWEN